MAKRRYRRYRRRRGRWAANIVEIDKVQTLLNPGTEPYFGIYETLATNPNQSNNTVSQAFTVKNFDINFTLEGNAYGQSYYENMTAYIMFLPQGYTVTRDYNLEHPEYILNYKYLGSPTTQQSEVTPETNNSTETQHYQPFRIKTRMARKLQTGDSIILFIKGYHQGNTSAQFQLRGLIRWYSKAN